MKENIKLAALFPGQGSQYPGMGKDLYGNFSYVRDIFTLASDSVGFDVKKLCFEGPEEKLERTDISQVAIITVSLACYTVFQKETGLKAPFITGGLSLGEYAALVSAGSIKTEDVFPIVHKRGIFMQEACEQTNGGMVSLIGLDEEIVRTICRDIQKEEYAEIANLNCPGQIVVSGTKKGLEQIEKKAKEKGAKKIIALKVSGAFHSRLMQSAADKLKGILEDNTILSPQNVQVVTNVTGEVVSPADDIKEILVKQVVSPVLWERSMKTMLAAGVDYCIEFGSGKVLGGLLKRIDKTALYTNIEDTGTLKSSINLINNL